MPPSIDPEIASSNSNGASSFQVHFEKLHRMICQSRKGLFRETGAIRIFTYNEHMSCLHGLVRHLDHLTSDKRALFDAYFSLITVDSEHLPKKNQKKRSRFGRNLRLIYWTLDDAVVESAVGLLQSNPRALDAAVCLAALREAKASRNLRVLRNFAGRSIQFFSEISRQDQIRDLSTRILGWRLPPEICHLVGDSMLIQERFPLRRRLLQLWGTPRPLVPTHCVETPPISWDFKGPCHQLTCPARTWATWQPVARQWEDRHYEVTKPCLTYVLFN